MPKKTQMHTFQLLDGMSLYTTFMVNGKPVEVNFRNGFRRPFIRRGFFMTDDPDIIKSIKSSGGYNVLFTQVSPEENKTQGKDNISDSDPEATSETTDPNKVTDDDLSDYEINTDINTGQKARAFLLSKLEGKITSSDLRTNADIRKVAEEYKIRFTNWPVEE